jgi:hypothetical protein
MAGQTVQTSGRAHVVDGDQIVRSRSHLLRDRRGGPGCSSPGADNTPPGSFRTPSTMKSGHGRIEFNG